MFLTKSLSWKRREVRSLLQVAETHNLSVCFTKKLTRSLMRVFILQWPATSQYPADLNSRRIFVVRELGNPLDKVYIGRVTIVILSL